MPRLLIKFALGITLVLTVLGLVARPWGNNQSPSPALRGFTEGCEGKPQPCWYGIVPGVTKFDDVPELLNAIPDWEGASIEKGSISLSPVWRITNPNFTDCTIMVEREDSSVHLVKMLDFDDCSRILFVDLAHFIEYPGIIYPDCFPRDVLTYRFIMIVTDDNLTFWGQNPVKKFELYKPRIKSDWIDLLNYYAQTDYRGAYSWDHHFRYAKIRVYEDGCG